MKFSLFYRNMFQGQVNKTSLYKNRWHFSEIFMINSTLISSHIHLWGVLGWFFDNSSDTSASFLAKPFITNKNSGAKLISCTKARACQSEKLLEMWSEIQKPWQPPVRTHFVQKVKFSCLFKILLGLLSQKSHTGEKFPWRNPPTADVHNIGKDFI